MKDGNQFYGWYDDPKQSVDQPTYNPPFDAPCPFCGFPITPTDVRTFSLLYLNDVRAYFYRTHRTCAETDPTGCAMDQFILDMIARNRD